jgi:hypothetical protein
MFSLQESLTFIAIHWFDTVGIFPDTREFLLREEQLVVPEPATPGHFAV